MTTGNKLTAAAKAAVDNIIKAKEAKLVAEESIYKPYEPPEEKLYFDKRKAGKMGKRTSEAKKLAAQILDNPAYIKSVEDRACAGTLAPAVECLLWHYRYGKPVNKVEVGEPGDFEMTELSDEDLAKRAMNIAERSKKRIPLN